MQKKTVKTAAGKTVSKKVVKKEPEKKVKKAVARKAPAKPAAVKTPEKKKKPVVKKAVPAVKKKASPKTVKSDVKAKSKSKPKTKIEKAKATPKAEPELDLETIVADLEEQRQDILESIEAKENLDFESGSGGDEADIASRNLNNEMLYELSSNDRIRIRDIEAALTKIKKGTYGICEHCKKPIERKRLKFMPYVRYCMACQNGSEASRRKMAE